MSLICIPKLCNISDDSILMLLLLLDLENCKIQQQRELTLGKKGYMKGPPDIMIMNHHPLYSGFCLEFKSPTNNYHTSDAQKEMKKQYKSNNYYFKSAMIMTLLSNVYLNTWNALESDVNIVKSRSFQRKCTLKLFIGLI